MKAYQFLLLFILGLLSFSTQAQTSMGTTGSVSNPVYDRLAEVETQIMDVAHNNLINFVLTGGSGGQARAGDCYANGGQGATVRLTVRLGDGLRDFPMDTEFRFVAGAPGDNGDSGASGDASGGGGGGSAILFKRPTDSNWTILAVAGGGGGAVVGNILGSCIESFAGQGGRATTNGGDGGGNGGSGGTNRSGGDAGGATGGMGAGGGGADSGGESSNGGAEGGAAGGILGGEGGVTNDGSQTGSGGGGFGGGGGAEESSGADGGGGGGGYSGGGGGGAAGRGGGGGSYVNTLYVTESSIEEGGNGLVAGGTILYAFTCTPGSDADRMHIWTGAVSSDWEESGNWSTGVIPNDEKDHIIIPSGSEVELTNNLDAYSIRSLTIESGATLSLFSSVEFNITPDRDCYAIENNGTINNFGSIAIYDETTIGATSTTVGIENQGTINNRSSISIGGNATGIDNSGTFINTGQISMGALSLDEYGILNQSGAVFENNVDEDNGTIGQIYITNALERGINNLGTFTNNRGIITVDDNCTIYGIQNNRTITNNQGTINVQGVDGKGIRVIGTNAVFTNTGGIVNLDNNGETDLELSARARFINQDTSQLNIGTNNPSGTANAILVSSLSPFANTSCATITVNTSGAISTISDGTFSNKGLLIYTGNANCNISFNGGVIQNLGTGFFAVSSGDPAVNFPQTKWLASEDSDWSNPCNWTGGVPVSGSVVIIGSESAGTPAVMVQDETFKALVVESGAQLSVPTAYTLTVDGADDLGIDVAGQLTNSGRIQVTNTGGDGIRISGASATITSYGDLLVGNTLVIDNIARHAIQINNGGTLELIDNGTDTDPYIYLDLFGENGIHINGGTLLLEDNDASNSQLELVIGSFVPPSTNDRGINLLAGTVSNSGAIIDINKLNTGVNIAEGSTFNNLNDGILSVGSQSGQIYDCIYNRGTLDNTTGIIKIKNADNYPLDNLGGTVINDDGRIEVEGYIAGIFSLSGTLAPGNPIGQVETAFLNFGTNNTTLEIEVNGTTPITEHDVVHAPVFGSTLGGTLKPIINYTPTDGDRIVFMTTAGAALLNGTFDNIDPALPTGWYVDYYSIENEVALVYAPNLILGIWDGDAGDGEWNTAANWSGDVLPMSNNDVVIDNGDAVTLSSGDVNVKSLSLYTTSSLSISAGVSLTVSGTYDHGGGLAASIWIVDNAALNNSGDIYLTGEDVTIGLNCESELTNNTGANLSFSTSGFNTNLYMIERPGVATTILNHGTITTSGAEFYALLLTSGTFTNASGGVIDINNTPNQSIFNSSTFTNAAGGIVDIDGGYFGVNNNGSINNAGVLTINNTTAAALGNGEYANFTNTGSIKGTGNYNFEVELDGSIVPGNLIGTMSLFGDQVFTATNTMEIEVDGTTPDTQHDVIDVENTATISGTLVPSINYTPTDGDRIVFLTATTISGTFSSISPALPDFWRIDYSVPGEVALVYDEYVIGLWDGDAGDGEWNTAANWDGDILPTTMDDVLISNGDSVTLSSGDVDVRSVRLTAASSLAISTGASLVVDGGAPHPAGTDVLIWIGPYSRLTNSGDISKGQNSTNDAFYCEGTLINHTGANITISGADSYTTAIFMTREDTNFPLPSIVNGGTITINDPEQYGIYSSTGGFFNLTGGITDISNPGMHGIYTSGNGGFINEAGGTVNLNGGENGIMSPNYLENAGLITINNINSYALVADVFFNNTGSLKGTGFFELVGNHLGGVVMPGNTLGTMTFYGNQEFTDSSTIEIEINGTTANTEHDVVDVTGTATISGTLAPSINYTPADGDRIVFLTATNISGTFSSISPALPEFWSVDYSVAGEVALVYDEILGLWDGDAGDGEWNTAANWSGDILPTADDDVVIDNGDAVTLSSGTIEVSSIELLSTSSLTIASGVDLTVSGYFNWQFDDRATMWIGNNASLINSGNINLIGINDPDYFLTGFFCSGSFTNNAGASLSFSESDFDRAIFMPDFTGGTPTIVNSGSITILRPGTSAIEVDAGTFTNADGGFIDLTATGSFLISIILEGTTFTNAAGGTIEIDGGGRGIFNRGTFHNAGDLTINNTATQCIYNISSTGFTNTGSLQGTGAYRIAGFDLDGQIIPGSSPGTMTFNGNQVFTASNTIEIEVDGTTPDTEHDVIAVASTATISGTLSVSINYTPADGDRIVFLTATTISGTFSSISPALPTGWSIDYSVAGEVALIYETPVTAVCQDIIVEANTNCSAEVSPEQLDGGSVGNNLTFSLDQTGPFSLGLTEVILTVDDGSSSDQCTASITVVDATAPTAIAQDITVQLEVTGSVTITGADIDNGSSDNCGIPSLSVSPNSFDCSQLGDNVVTLTVTDDSGNESETSATVTVVDESAPVALAQDITVQLGATGSVTITGADIDNGSTDNCGIQSLSVSPNSFDCRQVEDNIVTLTVTDASGNESEAMATVTIVDEVAPIALTQDITVQLDATGSVTITGSDIDNGSNDNCGIQSLEVSPSSFDCSQLGDNIVMLTVTDDSGNESEATATVTIVDGAAPVALAQDITIQLDATGSVTITGTDIDNGSTDNCGIQSLEVSPSSFDCSQLGDNSVTLTVTDNNGNESEATATVTIVDEVVPVALAQDITVQLDATGLATIAAAAIDNGSTDNCGIPSLSVSPNSFDCSDVGDNVVTLTVTDDSGNESEATATVTVADEVAPVALAQDITVQLDATGSVTITGSDIDNGSTDNCGIQSLEVSPSSFDCSQLGDNSVTLTVTDNNGNESDATATVTIVDEVVPVALAQDITVQLDATGLATIAAADIDNGSTDNCGIPSLSVSPNSFDCSQVGDNIVTLTVTDASGNESEATATVTVADEVAPVALAQDITVQLDANGSAIITAADIDNGSNDNCGIPSLSVSPNSFDCSRVGDNLVTLTVLDNNGNESETTATVTVVDEIRPTLTCPTDMVVNTDPGECGAYVTLPKAAPADNCSIEEMLSRYRLLDDEGNPLGNWYGWQPDHSGFFEPGLYQVQWRASDPSGNNRSCSIQLSVIDEETPEVVCKDVTVSFNGEETIIIESETIFDQAASFDACGPVNFASQSLDEISCASVGEVVLIQVDGVDQHGNTSSCTAAVTVDGNPCGFTATDIECSEGASASYDPEADSFTLTAKDCEGYPDGEYALMTTELCGDGEIIAKVASLSGDGRAGVIMLESLAPDARFVSKIKDFTPRTRTEYRSSTGGNISYKSKNRSGVKWLRIVRTGQKFKTYTSTNGSYWRLAHTIEYETFADCIQVGLVTYSKQADQPVTAIFEQVKVIGDSPSALEQNTSNTIQDLQGTNAQQLQTNLRPEIDLSVAPNPFAIQTQIEFTLPTASDVSLEIYNLHGQRVHSLENARLDAGTHRYQWEGQSSKGESLPTGIYMLRLRANKKWFTTKVSLVNR